MLFVRLIYLKNVISLGPLKRPTSLNIGSIMLFEEFYILFCHQVLINALSGPNEARGANIWSRMGLIMLLNLGIAYTFQHLCCLLIAVIITNLTVI